MKSIGRICAAAAGVMAIGTAGAALGQASTSGSADIGAAIARCAALADNEDRHACTDDAMRAAGLLREPLPAERRSQFGRPKAVKAPKPPKAKREEAVRAQRERRPEEAERIEVTLQSVSDRGDGLLILTTTDGAVWKQSERNEVRPRPEAGQMMVIEKGALGSFRCMPGKWTVFRCMRQL